MKFGRTENLLDMLMQYENLEFFRLGLIGGNFSGSELGTS
jgi:hypothetical protein